MQMIEDTEAIPCAQTFDDRRLTSKTLMGGNHMNIVSQFNLK